MTPMPPLTGSHKVRRASKTRALERFFNVSSHFLLDADHVLISSVLDECLIQIPKFGIVLVVVLVLGALGFRDRKETNVLQLICSVSLIAKRSGFSRTRTTTSILESRGLFWVRHEHCRKRKNVKNLNFYNLLTPNEILQVFMGRTI